METSTKEATKFCRHCKLEMPKDAKVCGHCSRKQQTGSWFGLGILFMVMGLYCSLVESPMAYVFFGALVFCFIMIVFDA